MAGLANVAHRATGTDIRLERPISRPQQREWDQPDSRSHPRACAAAVDKNPSLLCTHARIMQTGGLILSTHDAGTVEWIFTGNDTVGVGCDISIPNVGYITLRAGTKGKDRYVDMLMHTSSTREFPVLTPYKPNRYPEQAGLQVYSFLIDNAA